MADEPTPTPDAPPADPAPTEPPATDALGDAGKKALDSERREKRAAEKRANELEARLKEFEARDLSEQERALKRAEEAETRLREIESHAMRLEVASEKGLTPAQAKRLVGSTREELEADADELLDTFKPAEPASPSLDLGRRPSPTSEPSTPRERIAEGLAQYMK